MDMSKVEIRMLADPRVQELTRQWEISENLRAKFMATSPDKPDELLINYDAFMKEWRKFHKLRRELWDR